MGKEQVPKVAGEGRRKTGDDGKEVGLEGLDGMLSGTAAMHIGRDKMVLHFLHVFNGGIEFGTDFVVKDLEISVVAMAG